MEQKDRGELTLQKIGTLRDNIMKSVSHTQSYYCTSKKSVSVIIVIGWV